MVFLSLESDILAYFQGETEPNDMQRHINGVLRYYMETNLMREADKEFAAQIGERAPEPQPLPPATITGSRQFTRLSGDPLMDANIRPILAGRVFFGNATRTRRDPRVKTGRARS